MIFPVGNFHEILGIFGAFLTAFVYGGAGFFCSSISVGVYPGGNVLLLAVVVFGLTGVGFGGAGAYFGSTDLIAGMAPTTQIMKERIKLNTTKGHGVGILFEAY